MTATDPQLAAMPAEKLAPAAEALASAYAEDRSAAPAGGSACSSSARRGRRSKSGKPHARNGYSI